MADLYSGDAVCLSWNRILFLYSLQFSRPSCLRRSVAGISPQRHGFDPRPVHVRTVGDSITGTGFSPSTSVFLHQYHSTNVPYPFIQIPPTLFCLSVLLLSPVSTIPTTVPYPLIHLPPTLYNVSLPVLLSSPVSIIPPMLHSRIYPPTTSTECVAPSSDTFGKWHTSKKFLILSPQS